MRSIAHGLFALLPLLPSVTSQCAPSGLVVRVPPTLGANDSSLTSTSNSFTAPPPTWFSGNWHVTYSASPTYKQLQDMQYDSYPILPTCEAATPGDCGPGTFPGQLVDLTSFTTSGGGGKVHTAFGYDTPRRLNDPSLGPEWDAVYDFKGAGDLSYVVGTRFLSSEVRNMIKGNLEHDSDAAISSHNRHRRKQDHAKPQMMAHDRTSKD